MRLEYPLGGLSDNLSLDKQPPLTSRSAENERAVDPVTNRVRGAQRAGATKFCATRLGTSKVQALAQVTYDGNQTTYAHAVTSGPGDLTTWGAFLSSQAPCSGVVHDSQGNSYALDGNAAVSKFNRDGVKVWTFALPVQDEAHVVRAIAIDNEDHLYFGVSYGGAQHSAWIRCYVADSTKNLVRLWQKTPGGYCEKLQVVDDKLYAAINKVDSARSEYHVYENIAVIQPNLAFVKDTLPYPLHDLFVKSNGEVLTASGPTTGRYYDPRVPECTSIFDTPRWNPTMLSDWDKRKWVWLSASDIKSYLPDITDGEEVSEWRDTRGRGLCVMRPDASSAKFKAPTYVEHSLGYKPGVRFSGNFFRMVSGASVGNTESVNDIQPLLLPGRGKGYLIVAVVKVSDDATNKGRLFLQQNFNGGTNLREIWLNSAAGGGAASQGKVSVVHSAFVAGNNPNGEVGQFDNRNGAMIFTMMCDNNEMGLGSQFSVWRINGTPVAKFTCDKFWTNAGAQSYFGCHNDGTFGPYVDILEWFVLQSYDSAGVETVATAPQYDANDAGVNPAYAVGSDTEVERIEGHFGILYGISHLLDGGELAADSAPTWGTDGGSSEYSHPFSLRSTAVDSSNAPPNPNGRDGDANGSSWDLVLLRDLGIAAKWSAQRGNIRVASTGGGVGYAIAATADGSGVYCAGPRAGGATTGASSKTIRKFTDTGASWANAWSYAELDGGGNSIEWSYDHPRIAVDSFDNLWVPFNYSGSLAPKSVLMFRPSGGGAVSLAYALAGSTTPAGRAVSIDPRQPDYTGNPTTIVRPEFIVLGTDNDGVLANPVLHQVRAVDSINNNVSSRIVQYVGVCNGDISTFTSGGVVTPVGVGALSSNANYISVASAFRRVFFTDGLVYKVYNPRTGLVEPWVADDGGAMQPRFKLLAYWRGRMVSARGADQPQNWQMSEYGNPFGWDFFPPDSPLATQAVIGNEAEIGECPDIINTVIPYDRERLIFGCDHTIYIMFGDPMEGGSIVLASDVTGMLFGSPWAKDSSGIVYFFGSRGGVYAMNASGTVKKISSETIDRRLQGIEFGIYTVGLVWDEDLQELRIWQMPYGAGGTIVPHWAWCKRTNSWHQDRFSVTTIQPTCAMVFDSDSPVDRVVAYGTENGYVLKVDREAADDDGYAIESFVEIGPYHASGKQVRLRNVKVTLASEQGGCRLELGASERADAPFVAQHAFDLVPGPNPTFFRGVRGAYTYARLHSAQAGQRWAMEEAQSSAIPAGRKAALA